MPKKSKKPGHRSDNNPQGKAAVFELDFRTLQKAAAEAKSTAEWEKAVATLDSQRQVVIYGQGENAGSQNPFSPYQSKIMKIMPVL